MNFEPEYWGSLSDLADEDEVCEPSAWCSVLAVFAAGVFVAGWLAFIVVF